MVPTRFTSLEPKPAAAITVNVRGRKARPAAIGE
jgi:hypothetical protein